MARAKLTVTEVWILQEIEPYDGSEIIGVFVDPEVAMAGRNDRGRWKKDPADGDWDTRTKPDQSEGWYYLSKHTLRTK